MNRRSLLKHMLPFLCVIPAIGYAQSGSESLGTLLYSQRERGAIVAARAAQQGMGGFNYDMSVSVKGLVKRMPAQGTTWINGQTVTEGQAITSGGVPVIGTKSVTVEGRAVRVGETLDLESGERVDLIPQGSLSVRRQK
jgi:hypothetical protein